MYKQYQQRISLRGFCCFAEVARWHLRYYLETEQQRRARSRAEREAHKQVKAEALKHPTYGYRRIYVELDKRFALGRERARNVMAHRSSPLGEGLCPNLATP